jgi:transposase
VVSVDDRTVAEIHLGPGNVHDSPEGRVSIAALPVVPEGTPLLMDRAYEGDSTRAAARAAGLVPVVPPKANRWNPWEHDEELYKRRNEVERVFRRIKHYRKVFTRYDKLDVIYLAVVMLAFVAIHLK